MLFGAMLLYLGIVYIRPGEVLPGWIGFPFLHIAAVVALITAAVSLFLDRRYPTRSPLDGAVLLFCAVIAISNPLNGWLGGATKGISAFAPVAFCYFLIRLAVRTRRQFTLTVGCLVVLSLFQASNGILQFYTGQGLGNVTAYRLSPGVEGVEDREDGERVRIRGTGIFNDPNDLAMALVMVVPFLVSGVIGPGIRTVRRLVSVLALGPLLTAIALTNSRGGTLALASIGVAQAVRRFGYAVGGVVAALVVVAAVAVGPSRMGQLNATEASAQGRIQAWSAGIQMFKMRPLYGVGFAKFRDHNDNIVAHNSFVHSFAELGLLGALCFTAMVYWYWRSVRSPASGQVQQGEALWGKRELALSGLATLTCMMFLSRQYNVVPFVLLALGATAPALQEPSTEPQLATTAPDLVRIALLTVGGIVGIYVLVRALARWS